MTTQLMDGKHVSAFLQEKIRAETTSFALKGQVPTLAVILIGEDPASVSYVTAKEKTCQAMGMRSIDIRLPADAQESEVLAQVEKLNLDPKVHGILVQLPLPPSMNEKKILQKIRPEKDVDGFLPVSMGKLLLGEPSFVACTPAGILELLDYYKIPLSGKHAVVVGRSLTVGKPVALLLLDRNCTVTICHSRTENLGGITSQADILIAAAGKPELIRGSMVKEGAVVIDVGVNRIADASKAKGFRLVGDTCYGEMLGKASFITPVPGGVGPMTIALLMRNTLRALELSIVTES